LRNWGILRGLTPHHEVSLLSFAGPDQEPEAPEEITSRVARVTVIRQPQRTTGERLRHLVSSSRPDLAQRLESEPFRAEIRAWLADHDFDWVLVEGLELAPYLDELDSLEAPPRVAFDDHNCETLLQRRAFATDVRRPGRWPAAAYSLVQWQRLRRYEAAVCRRADLVVAVSEADAAALRRMAPGVEPLVLPNGISVAEYATFEEQAPLRQPAFVFTGTMDFRPNVDGALWFTNEVWPRLRAQLPDAHFYVVGKRPHRRLEPLGELPHVVVTGSVPDTRPYINGARVYVVPLRVGGGTRFKILEASAMGKAVVSTSLGAEGFPRAKEALILADDPLIFADACVRLAREADLRAQLTAETRAFVESYDWEVLLPPLIRRLE
jgi:glycosyltransferase involved in cell wall biosynthesis